MMSFKNIISDKYNRIEIVFFIMYYVLFPVLSNLEYSLLEKGRLANVIWDSPELFFQSLKAIIAGLVFYKILVQGYLFKKKYIKFTIGLIVYLVLLNFYIAYSYLLISKTPFLPNEIIANALKWYNSGVPIHFSISYMFREFLVLTALAYFIKSAKQEKQIDQLARQQLSAELNYLKTQIQPHFFFNTLNSIYALTLQRSAKAATLVAKHADSMRYMLYMAAEPTIALEKEVDFLRNYVELEAIRYPERIKIDFEVQGILQNFLIEPLLLLPFVENAFKHGASEKIREGFILIIISQMDNELSMEVSNSKSNRVSIGGHKGIGLKNSSKRLAILYPEQHSLRIDEEADTFTVYLTLQLKRK